MNEEFSIKERLLRVATRIFAKDGFDRASIRQIAGEAGVNSSMISYHFGGKRGLYEAVLKAEFAAVSDFESRDFTEEDPRDVIRAYAEEVLALHRAHPEMRVFIYQELMASAPGGNTVFRWVSEQASQILSDALERGIQQKLFREDINAPVVVLALAGMVAFHFQNSAVA